MAGSMIPAPIVPAPEPIGGRYGLFTAASGPLDLPQYGEGAGVRYVPLTCGQARNYGVACYGTGEGQTAAPDKTKDADNAEVSTGVFLALATLECSAVGYDLVEYQTKVSRRLATGEQAAVEDAFWTGEDFQGNPLGILNLSDSAEDIPSGYDPGLITDVIGGLERYAYTLQGYGYRAYIHAPVEVAAFAHESGQVLKDGNRLVTPMGSIWAFGAYPAGSVMVTGQTTVWRGAVQTYDAFEPTTNLRLLVAERAYSVAFDCFAGRAEFDPLEVTSP
jgi:hypothetical protein